MVRGDSRLLANLVSHEKEVTKHWQSLLTASSSSLSSLTAYAAAAPPTTSRAILNVAAVYAAADNTLQGYACALNDWRDLLKGLHQLEEEVVNIIRDREILVTRLIKASNKSSAATSSPASNFRRFTASSTSLHTQASGNTQIRSIPTSTKVAAAQAELQACETHLAAKERELTRRRLQVIRDGLALRSRSMIETGKAWASLGHEAIAVLEQELNFGDRSSLVEPVNYSKPLPSIRPESTSLRSPSASTLSYPQHVNIPGSFETLESSGSSGHQRAGHRNSIRVPPAHAIQSEIDMPIPMMSSRPASPEMVMEHPHRLRPPDPVQRASWASVTSDDNDDFVDASDGERRGVPQIVPMPHRQLTDLRGTPKAAPITFNDAPAERVSSRSSGFRQSPIQQRPSYVYHTGVSSPPLPPLPTLPPHPPPRSASPLLPPLPLRTGSRPSSRASSIRSVSFAEPTAASVRSFSLHDPPASPLAPTIPRPSPLSIPTAPKSVFQTDEYRIFKESAMLSSSPKPMTGAVSQDTDPGVATPIKSFASTTKPSERVSVASANVPGHSRLAAVGTESSSEGEVHTGKRVQVNPEAIAIATPSATVHTLAHVRRPKSPSETSTASSVLEPKGAPADAESADPNAPRIVHAPRRGSIAVCVDISGEPKEIGVHEDADTVTTTVAAAKNHRGPTTNYDFQTPKAKIYAGAIISPELTGGLGHAYNRAHPEATKSHRGVSDVSASDVLAPPSVAAGTAPASTSGQPLALSTAGSLRPSASMDSTGSKLSKTQRKKQKRAAKAKEKEEEERRRKLQLQREKLEQQEQQDKEREEVELRRLEQEEAEGSDSEGEERAAGQADTKHKVVEKSRFAEGSTTTGDSAQAGATVVAQQTPPGLVAAPTISAPLPIVTPTAMGAVVHQEAPGAQSGQLEQEESSAVKTRSVSLGQRILHAFTSPVDGNLVNEETKSRVAPSQTQQDNRVDIQPAVEGASDVAPPPVPQNVVVETTAVEQAPIVPAVPVQPPVVIAENTVTANPTHTTLVAASAQVEPSASAPLGSPLVSHAQLEGTPDKPEKRRSRISRLFHDEREYVRPPLITTVGQTVPLETHDHAVPSAPATPVVEQTAAAPHSPEGRKPAKLTKRVHEEREFVLPPLVSSPKQPPKQLAVDEGEKAKRGSVLGRLFGLGGSERRDSAREPTGTETIGIPYESTAPPPVPAHELVQEEPAPAPAPAPTSVPLVVSEVVETTPQPQAQPPVLVKETTVEKIVPAPAAVVIEETIPAQETTVVVPADEVPIETTAVIQHEATPLPPPVPVLLSPEASLRPAPSAQVIVHQVHKVVHNGVVVERTEEDLVVPASSVNQPIGTTTVVTKEIEHPASVPAVEDAQPDVQPLPPQAQGEAECSPTQPQPQVKPPTQVQVETQTRVDPQPASATVVDADQERTPTQHVVIAIPPPVGTGTVNEPHLSQVVEERNLPAPPRNEHALPPPPAPTVSAAPSTRSTKLTRKQKREDKEKQKELERQERERAKAWEREEKEREKQLREREKALEKERKHQSKLEKERAKHEGSPRVSSGFFGGLRGFFGADLVSDTDNRPPSVKETRRQPSTLGPQAQLSQDVGGSGSAATWGPTASQPTIVVPVEHDTRMPAHTDQRSKPPHSPRKGLSALFGGRHQQRSVSTTDPQGLVYNPALLNEEEEGQQVSYTVVENKLDFSRRVSEPPVVTASPKIRRPMVDRRTIIPSEERHGGHQTDDFDIPRAPPPLDVEQLHAQVEQEEKEFSGHRRSMSSHAALGGKGWSTRTDKNLRRLSSGSAEEMRALPAGGAARVQPLFQPVSMEDERPRRAASGKRKIAGGIPLAEIGLYLERPGSAGSGPARKLRKVNRDEDAPPVPPLPGHSERRAQYDDAGYGSEDGAATIRKRAKGSRRTASISYAAEPHERNARAALGQGLPPHSRQMHQTNVQASPRRRAVVDNQDRDTAIPAVPGASSAYAVSPVPIAPPPLFPASAKSGSLVNIVESVASRNRRTEEQLRLLKGNAGLMPLEVPQAPARVQRADLETPGVLFSAPRHSVPVRKPMAMSSTAMPARPLKSALKPPSRDPSPSPYVARAPPPIGDALRDEYMMGGAGRAEIARSSRRMSAPGPVGYRADAPAVTPQVTGDGGPQRRKSVRVSLNPTFSSTPPATPAVEYVYEAHPRGYPSVPSGSRAGEPPVAASSSRDVERESRARRVKDVWQDSSDEDEEYTKARAQLARATEAEREAFR